MTVTPLGRDQDCSLKIREPEVPAPFGSWILEVGARPPLACTSSSLESVPCPLFGFFQSVNTYKGTLNVAQHYFSMKLSALECIFTIVSNNSKALFAVLDLLLPTVTIEDPPLILSPAPHSPWLPTADSSHISSKRIAKA
ncbi:hypothetical protein STEG23_028606 [Scotinomys teguina]